MERGCCVANSDVLPGVPAGRHVPDAASSAAVGDRQIRAVVPKTKTGDGVTHRHSGPFQQASFRVPALHRQISGGCCEILSVGRKQPKSQLPTEFIHSTAGQCRLSRCPDKAAGCRIEDGV